MRLVAISAIVALLFFSCKKDNVVASRESVIGLWKLTAYTYSNGANSEWRSAIFLSPRYTEFTEDQKMINTGDSVVIYAYTLTSDSTLTIRDVSRNYDVPCRYELKSNELILIPLNCIEGCASKYRAVNHK